MHQQILLRVLPRSQLLLGLPTSARFYTTKFAKMPPKIVVGMMGSSVTKGSSKMTTPEQVKEFLSVVKSHGVKELDTALVYNDGKSEELLAAAGAKDEFLISTKAPGFSAGSLSEAKVLQNSAKSHKNLQQEKVDIYYIHGPDKETPLEEQCRAFGKLYKEERFERFGVSNLSPQMVQEIYDICKRDGYVLPTVYQGSYNPLHRACEQELFPLLRKLGISFYVWGPLAGGLLAKPIEELTKPREGSRYHEMPVFGNLYLNENNIAAIEKMTEVCKEIDLSMMEATMRWFMHSSVLTNDDAIILGASSKEQVDQTLKATEQGPLPQAVVDGFETLWETIVKGGKALPAALS